MVRTPIGNEKRRVLYRSPVENRVRNVFCGKFTRKSKAMSKNEFQKLRRTYYMET